jgi:hypothetical protein
MGYVAKAFEDLPELAFNLMRENLTKNVTTCLLLASLVFQIFIEGFVYFILITKSCHKFKYKVLSNLMNLFGFITVFLQPPLHLWKNSPVFFFKTSTISLNCNSFHPSCSLRIKIEWSMRVKNFDFSALPPKPFHIYVYCELWKFFIIRPTEK